MPSSRIRLLDIEIELSDSKTKLEELNSRALGLIMQLIPELQKLTADEGDTDSGGSPQDRTKDVKIPEIETAFYA